MTTKTKILAGVLVMGIVLIGGWWIWNSYFEKISVNKTTSEISKEKALKLANQILEEECNLSFSQIERISWTKGPEVENLKREICPTIDKYNKTEIWKSKISLNDNIEIIALVGIYGKFVCVYGLDKGAAPGIISIDKACGKTEKVTLSTDKTEYEQGEKIKVTIENNLNQNIWYYGTEEYAALYSCLEDYHYALKVQKLAKSKGIWNDVKAHYNCCFMKCYVKAPERLWDKINFYHS